MRLTLEDLMEKLGVDRVLMPYETQPWMHYDEEKAITCSAEVRMGPSSEDLETEVQFIHDDPNAQVEDEEDDDEDEDGKGGAGAYGVPPPKDEKPKPVGPKHRIVDGQEQIMMMRIEPNALGEWTTVSLKVKSKEYKNVFYDWETKGCDFFRAIIEAMLMGELPEITELMESTLKEDDSWGGGRRGRIGRKSPKVKPGQLLGMKKGM